MTNKNTNKRSFVDSNGFRRIIENRKFYEMHKNGNELTRVWKIRQKTE